MSQNKLMKSRFRPVVIPLTALLALAGYVVFAYASSLAGFPLDDTWIHQTYARNLAETGQLAYLPGQPSTGSTSLAWSYLLGIDQRSWAYLLGSLSLAADAWFAYCLCLQLRQRQTGTTNDVSPNIQAQIHTLKPPLSLARSHQISDLAGWQDECKQVLPNVELAYLPKHLSSVPDLSFAQIS